MFGKGHSAANAEKLKYELKKKAASPGAAKPLSTPQVTQRPVASGSNRKTPEKVEIPETPAKSVLYHELPPVLRQVLLEAHELYTKNCLLKAELNDILPEMESEAFAIQWQIYGNRLQNQRCWSKIDHWKKHKTIPVTPPAVNPFTGLTPAELLKREGNLESSSSKLRKRCREYEAALEHTNSVGDKTKLERALGKSSGNLLRQEQDLALIRKMISGHE
jgi:hypothetical protein